MKLLEQRIRTDGMVKPDGVLKVDSFLNHQIDPALLRAMARELRRLYDGCRITKVLTIEASGIGLACFVAEEFGCSAVYAKKSLTRNMSGDVYLTQTESFTHGCTYQVMVSKSYLSDRDSVLIVDDFLANGEALSGLVRLCQQAGAAIVGAGIAIEKTFQPGGEALRKAGLRIESLARISAMDPEKGLEFC